MTGGITRVLRWRFGGCYHGCLAMLLLIYLYLFGWRVGAVVFLRWGWIGEGLCYFY